MKKHTNTSRIYIITAIIVLIGGMLLSGYSAYSSYKSQREFLGQRVAGLATALPRDVIANLPGEESDAGTKDYLTLKKTLQDIAAVNPDIRFIYVTKQRDNKIYFLADSEPEGSEDESPPGQEYEEADPDYREAHININTAVIGPTKDRWGTWISGVSSIVDDDEISAVLGMDIPADKYIQNVIVSAVILMIPTVLFSTLLFMLASRSRLREKDLAERMNLLTLVTDNVRTPLEGVRWASEQLAAKEDIKNSPELNQLAMLLSTGTAKVIESVKDIVDATESSKTNTHIAMDDRVDIVALVIDVVDSLKLNALTKNINILLGSSWPASYIIDTNEKELNRAIAGIITRVVTNSQSQHSINLDFVTTDGRWMVRIYDPAKTQADTLRLIENLAVQQLILRQLGAELQMENDNTIRISSPIKSSDIQK